MEEETIDLCAPAPYTAFLKDADDPLGRQDSVGVFGPGLSAIMEVPKAYGIDNCREIVRKVLLALPAPVVMP